AVTACLFLGGLQLAHPVRAQITNGMAASGVLGPADLITRPAAATTASRFNGPNGVTLDPTTGKLFVADRANHRVLRFGSSDAMINGAAAEAVLGQPDFTTATSGLSAVKMNNPIGVHVDAAGRLWVGDFTNNRVLRFDNASAKANGAPADGVLGQLDFVTSASGNTALKTSGPCGIATDASGRLYVSNFNNHRVTRYDDAANKPNGAAADGVLGQPDFTTVTSGITQSKLSNPNSVFVDAAGRLWVSDYANRRAVRYDDAANKPNGAPADGVLGQPDFTTNTAGVTQSKFSNTRYVHGDATGRIFVVEEANNRIMVFDNAATLPNGSPATNVIGQASFTVGSALNPPTASTLATPRALVLDEANGRMWVADWANQRVLRYQIVAGVGTSLVLAAPNGGEDWGMGTIHAIAWGSVNVANVDIEYSVDGGATWLPVASNVPAAAQAYAWTVPSTPTTQGLVRVTDSSNPALTDQSNAPFTISVPVASVALVSPNGLQQWPAGSQRKILFTSANLANVRIEVSANGGGSWTEVVASAPAASGSYLWDVPATLGNDYRVRLSNAIDALVNDASDQSFAIVAPLAGHDFDALFFSDSPTPVYVDASFTSVTAPSLLERAATDKAPVSTTYSLVGNYSLRMAWTSAAGGDWALANAGAGWPGQDASTRDSLIFNVMSPTATSAAGLPCLYLEDLGNRKTPKVPLSAYLSGVSAGSWQRIAIPMQVFRDNPGTADLTSIKTVFFGQQTADAVPHVWYLDDVRMTGGVPATGDSTKLIVILGSSTSAGTGASSPDSAWVGRYRAYLHTLDPDAIVVNLAIGGYTTYNVMPTSFVPPPGRPAPNPRNNITHALTYKPWAIIVNLPSNDVTNGYSVAEQLANYDTLRTRAAAMGVPIWITTSQPRNLADLNLRDRLRVMADSTLARYAPNAIDLYYPLVAADGTILPQYGSGDGIHLNDAGHGLVFRKVVEAGVWQQIDPSVEVTDPNGGEVLYLGIPDTLRWTAGNTSHVTGFDLAVSQTGPAGPFTAIGSVGGAAREFVWNVTGSASSADCFFRVTATGTPGDLATDASNAAFSIIDLATPTLLTEFSADALESGVEVRWQFAAGIDASQARLLRADSEVGPWEEVDGELRIEENTAILLDREAPAGRTLYYCLVATTAAGQEMTFGPISTTANQPVLAYSLGRIAPNPATGPVSVEFSLPVSARVDVTILDVQGRVTAQLANGLYAAGRHTVAWNARSSSAAGVYFARYRVAGHESIRRFIVVK
ncbi:MAG: SMP-30/gluconolactonase/LRE family protein, partial [Candidatus Eisenbacteria bacterium]|nr:SMP-30/gluconolactonase/LRE family protein [Candidatus Eisenbacteria bacterium]